MKKSYIKLLIFNIVIFTILFLNSFIWSILNYYNMLLLTIILIVIFKLIFGTEKNRHRYDKEIVLNIIIIFLVFIICFYLLGLIIGFTKTNIIYGFNAFARMILPYILIVLLKEYLRYQSLVKAGKSKFLTIIICIMFIFWDITNQINIGLLDTGYKIYIFFTTILLPAISKNITSGYIAKRVGYIPNILWILLYELYSILLPIVPNSGIYIKSMIDFLYPLFIGYNVFYFFLRKERKVPVGKGKKAEIISMPFCVIFISILVYFTSGFFKYYAITIGSGSMQPNINIGDIVIINQKYDISKLKTDDIIAYEYENKIVIHRLVKIEKVTEKDYYYYTKGDANNAIDNYVIHEDMIIGKVEQKLPYIGYPTIWLNEIK